jgi:hypothetical protein
VEKAIALAADNDDMPHDHCAKLISVQISCELVQPNVVLFTAMHSSRPFDGVV